MAKNAVMEMQAPQIEDTVTVGRSYPVPWVITWIFYTLVGAAVLVRLLIAWAPPNLAFRLTVPDDAYYYFVIAENLASGAGPTFDGLAPTNGFHPLWMWLIVPFWWLGGASSTLPVHLSLSLGALLDIGSMLGLYRLTLRLTALPATAMAVVLCYSWNPYSIAASVNGLETSLATCLFIWSLLHYLQIRAHADPAKWLGFGLLVAALTLARTDYLILVIPMLLDLVWRHRRDLRSSWWAGVGLAAWIPWVAWNMVAFGTPFQVSGRAYPYYLETIWIAEGHTPGEWLFAQGEKAYEIVANLARFSGFGHAILLLGLLGAYLAVVSWLRREEPGSSPPGVPRWESTGPLVLTTVCAFAVLLVHAWFRWMYLPWYFVPASVLIVLWFGVFLAWAGRRRVQAVAVLTVVFLLFQSLEISRLAASGGMWPTQAETATALLPVMQQQCLEHERIGVTDAGFLAYFAPCDVVNLDGVVNNQAYRAIREGRFRRYLQDNQIGFVLLNPIVRQVVELKEGPIPDGRVAPVQGQRFFGGRPDGQDLSTEKRAFDQ